MPSSQNTPCPESVIVLGKLLKYRAAKKRLSEQSLPPDEMRALREAKLHEFSHPGINERTMLRCDRAA